MALEAERGADALIRQVQKVLGKASQAATFAALLYGRKGLDGLEELPPDRLADDAREATGLHRRQAERAPQGARPSPRRGRQREACRERADRDRQRRHAVPRRLGAGRAADARHRRAPAPAPDLRGPARQGRPPAGYRAGRRGRCERRAPGKLHRRPRGGAVRAGGARSCRRALRHPAGGAPGRRGLAADAGAPRDGGAAAGAGAGQRAPRSAGGVDEPSWNGSERTTSRSWGRASSSSPAMPDPATLSPSRAAGLACCATRACRCCAAAPSWWR